MTFSGKKVYVGLSGGVDSAVTALLLKEAGAIVTGVFIRGAYPEGLPCTWADDRRDAMRVAARLRIPFVTLDAHDAYQTAVIDYLAREYKAGRTPNPDVMCNRDVKFGIFYKYAVGHGADFIATGHYARVESGCILRGKDANKDQSYFLWAVSRETLNRILFPLGDISKAETRRLAKRFELPVAEKKDSQGICFLGNVSIEEFLRDQIGLTEGEVRDESGTVLGKHRGAIAYTLGERIPLSGGPWYVARKDIVANAVIVTRSKEQLGEPEAHIRLTDTNWQQDPASGKQYSAQYRYHGPIITGKLTSDHMTFVPDSPLHEPLAAGQSLVLYDDDVLLGGGIIAA